MAQRIDNDPPERLKLRRKVLSEKLLSKDPSELMDLFTNGDTETRTKAAQEMRRAMVMCVLAIKSLMKE